MLKKQPKEYFRKRLAERLNKDPQAKMEDLDLYIRMLGLKEVQNAQGKSRLRNKRDSD